MNSPWFQAGTVVSAMAVLFSVLAPTLGCDARRQKERQEFARLNQSLQRLQRADNEAKAPYLKDFSGQGCQHLCSFRDQCEKAYRNHQRALDLLEQVRSRLNGSAIPSRDVDALEERQAAEKLAYAKSLLVLSRTQTKQCAARQGELTRELGH